jgi:uncharacterized protein YerC
MKKKIADLSEKERIATLDTLYTAASAVRGRNAVKRFLRDLLTPSERIMLGRRIMIARLLLAGENEAGVGRRLGVGPNTVYRVAKWLDDQLPGYEEAVAGLEKELVAREAKRRASIDPFSFAALKRKYPLHFLLFRNPRSHKKT